MAVFLIFLSRCRDEFDRPRTLMGSIRQFQIVKWIETSELRIKVGLPLSLWHSAIKYSI